MTSAATPTVRLVPPLGLSLGARAALDGHQLEEITARLDALGDTALWLPEGTLHEPFAALAFAAATTSRLALATGVAPFAARSAATAALAAATLNRFSEGRAVLGLGVGHPPISRDWHGVSYASELTWTREYVSAVRQILDGGASKVEGAEVRSVGFRLLAGGAPDIPLILAALGPKMLALAGEVADGAVLNWATPEHARRSAEMVRDAATAAGRPRPQVGVYVRVVAGSDTAALARSHTRIFFERDFYVRTFRRMGLTEGDDPIGDTADRLILRGTPDEVVNALSAWTGEAGVDFIVLYPIGDGDAFKDAVDLSLSALETIHARRDV
jgi:alkanesulfonate monooxygenase SsuD/methylene tetrahydromethanopterin reductase-like flavin-dependent oxidoreductase (luciferase family)